MPEIDIVTLIGAAAAVASTASFAPQAWRVIRTHEVKGLSAGMYLLTVCAFALWMAYGIERSDWAIIVPNGLCFLLSLFILLMVVLPAATRREVADKIEHAVEPGDPSAEHNRA